MTANDINILFTSSGRRVSLIDLFRETYKLHNLQGTIVTADLKPTAPTAFVSDKHYLVPRVTDPSYLEELLRICREENIRLVVPLIDTELELLSENRRIFEERGITLLLSSLELVQIAADKNNTYRFFSEQGIPTPKVLNDEEMSRGEYRFPLLIKPANGSSSQGVTKIRNEKELEFFREYIPNAIVQEYVTGEEYTIDVMVDFQGHIKTIVPRLRIETRAGEVSKGVTRKDRTVISAAEHVVKALPGPVGCITLQCFKQSDGRIVFIEMNPRFGGGIPLSIAAGANFPLWSIQLVQGASFKDEPDYEWSDRLTMIRYDEAIFRRDLSYDD